MAYINMVDINGRTYNLENLTDGEFEVFLPVLTANDEFILKSGVINNLTSYETKKPLSGYQGRVLSTKITDLTTDMNAKFEDLETYVNEQDTLLSDSIKAETTRATEAEKVLTDNLNKEIQDRADDVNAEKTRALAAEKVLTDNLTQEVTDRTNAVATEQNRATAKENEISAALTAEINRAKAAEETNATAIATEQSRAKGVESDHESRIVTMEAFFKEADIDASQEFIDTLKEIQTYIADDKTGAAAMTASIQTNKTAIEAEQSRAEIAEKANADAIAALEEKHNTEIATKVDKVDESRLMTTVEGDKLAGIAENANNYSHPVHTTYTSNLYKITINELGHVTEATVVTKEDIVGLGVPAQDTTYSDATISASGLLSSTDKTTYDGYATLISELQNKINELEEKIAILEGGSATE